MKKIGLYFGSFNPITTGHMLVAQESALHVDEVWFVISPHNPQKDLDGILGEYDRFSLVLSGLQSFYQSNDEEMNGIMYGHSDLKYKICDIEFSMDKPSYTYDTVEKLKGLFPEDEFHIITGTDAYMSVTTWKKGVELLKNIPFIIVKRGEKDEFHLKDSDIVLDGYSTMSATLVRDKVKKGEPLGYLVPGGVEKAIEKGGFYK